MPTFHGTLRLAAEPDVVHSATVILVDDRFVLRAAGSEVGDWPLQDLSFGYSGEDIRVRIDDDEALLSMPERGAFAAAVGLSESSSGAASAAAPEPQATPPATDEPDAGAAVAPLSEPTGGLPPALDMPTSAETEAAAPAAGRAEESAEAAVPGFEVAPTGDLGETRRDIETPESPRLDADFSVGFGGDQSAEPEPLAPAPESGFSVATPPSTPTVSPAGSEAGAFSPPGGTADGPPDDAGNSVEPPPAVVRTPADEPLPRAPDLEELVESPADPHVPPVAAIDVSHQDEATARDHEAPSLPVPPVSELEPGDGITATSSPPDTDPWFAPQLTSPDPEGEGTPPDGEDSAAAGEGGSTVADEDPPIGGTGIEPEPSDDEDTPLPASGAAAAVWSMRNPSPQTDTATDQLHPSDAVADSGQDDLVAARLADQRQTTLGGQSDPSEDPTTDAEPGTDGDTPVEDEPADEAESEATPDSEERDSDKRLQRLRSQSAAGYLDDETLRKWVAWGLLVGGLFIGLGAFLTWGDARIFETDFPVARVLAAVSAVAAVAGFILGFFMHHRLLGAYVAGTGAVLGLMTLFLYARAAGIGSGFFIALLGVIVVAGLATLAITPAGGSKDKRSGR